jgi:ribosomal protein S24E
MKRTTVAIGLVAALVAPAAAAGDQKPDDADTRAAAAQCKSERGATKATREAFKAKYGGMSRCVRQKTAEEAEEREDARNNAAKECKAERDEIGANDFAEKYGENENGRNAYGKCVSSKAKAKKAEMDAEDRRDAQAFKNAAKECAAEREAMGRDDFADKYGKNEKRRNAFGRCVSTKVRDS